MQKLIFNNLLYLIISFLIVLSTIFIPNKVENYTHPIVKLGYPVHFLTIDFKNNFFEASSESSKNMRFNFFSAWEKTIETSYVNFIVSLGITFFILKVLVKLVPKITSLR